jgi:hypothetical protein
MSVGLFAQHPLPDQVLVWRVPRLAHDFGHACAALFPPFGVTLKGVTVLEPFPVFATIAGKLGKVIAATAPAFVQFIEMRV